MRPKLFHSMSYWRSGALRDTSMDDFNIFDFVTLGRSFRTVLSLFCAFHFATCYPLKQRQVIHSMNSYGSPPHLVTIAFYCVLSPSL